MPDIPKALFLSLACIVLACLGAIYAHSAVLVLLGGPLVITLIATRIKIGLDLLGFLVGGVVCAYFALAFIKDQQVLTLVLFLACLVMIILTRSVWGECVLAAMAGIAICLAFAEHPIVHSTLFLIGVCAAASAICLVAHYSRIDFATHLELKDGISRRTQRIRYMLRERDEVTALAVHDLQSPIQAVAGMHKTLLHMLDREKPDIENVRHALEVAIETNNELSERIGSLLSTHRDYLGGAGDTADIASVVKGTIALHELGIKSKRISVSCDLPRAVFLRNEEDLKDILDVLLDNAIQHARENGKIEIRTIANPEKSLVSVEIHDDGEGIPDGKLGTLFALPDTKQESHVRQGMGLFLARRRVERLGGTLTYKRSDLGGACFNLVIPIVPSQS